MNAPRPDGSFDGITIDAIFWQFDLPLLSNNFTLNFGFAAPNAERFIMQRILKTGLPDFATLTILNRQSLAFYKPTVSFGMGREKQIRVFPPTICFLGIKAQKNTLDISHCNLPKIVV